MIPSVILAFTNQMPRRLNRRNIGKTRLSDNPYFRSKIEGLDNHTVDLIFIPSIIGNYNTNSPASVSELSANLSGYDLVIDTCEITALYRPGKISDENLREANSKFSDVDPEVNKNFLQYRNFLEIAKALNKLSQSIRGHIIRPRIFDAITYEWGFDRREYVHIRDYALLKNWSYGKSSEGWAPLTNSGDQETYGPILAPILEDKRSPLMTRIEKFIQAGMHTLKNRILLSGFMSDLKQTIVDLKSYTGKNGDLIVKPDSIFQSRDDKWNYADFSPNQKDEIDYKKDCFKKEMIEHDRPLQLIDYYQFSLGADSQFCNDTVEEFRREFANTFAFLKLWDYVEEDAEEHSLNGKINGWYMANSSYWILQQLKETDKLSAPITSWAMPVFVTNSLGFLPDADDYQNDMSNSLFKELNELISVNIHA